MANMVIPNEGKLKWLDWAVRDTGPGLEGLSIDLYTNDYTPVDGSSSANFTLATFTGYAQELLARTDFGAPSIVADVAEIVSAVVPTFTCTGGASQTCYGWVAHSTTSGKVMAAQRFDAARVMSAGSVELLDPFKIKLKTFA